jgi:hypothetical protein
MIALGGLNVALIVLIVIGAIAILPLVVLRARFRTSGRLHALPAA